MITKVKQQVKCAICGRTLTNPTKQLGGQFVGDDCYANYEHLTLALNKMVETTFVKTHPFALQVLGWGLERGLKIRFENTGEFHFSGQPIVRPIIAGRA